MFNARTLPTKKPILGLLLLGATSVITAKELPQPTGPVVLTVTGHITHTNADGAARFDMDMLQSLNPAHLVTGTPWDDGTVTFDGPALTTLMDAVGAQGVSMRISALNNYYADVPVTVVKQYDPVLAYRKNGATLPIRARGPLMVMFPYDQFNLYQDDNVQHYSVWQVNRIDVN